ncbi:MAG: hypothetical protein WCQ91_04485 [Planctomycetota bacterium]
MKSIFLVVPVDPAIRVVPSLQGAILSRSEFGHLRGGRVGMSEKQAGGIVVSSFIAGLIFAAALFAPHAWDPVPEPFFGLEEPLAEGILDESLAGSHSCLVESTIAVDANRRSGGLAAHPAIVAEAIATTGSHAPTAAPSPLRGTGGLQHMAAVLAATPPERLAMNEPSGTAAARTAVQTVQAQTVQAQIVPPTIAQVHAVPPPKPEPIHPRLILPPPVGGSLGSAPMPGENWSNPDTVNWSETPTSQSPENLNPSTSPRFGLLTERRHESRGDGFAPTQESNAPNSAQPTVGGRILDRLRVGERLLSRERASDAPQTPSTVAPTQKFPADISVWPTPVKLLEQLEQLAALHPKATGTAGMPAVAWATHSLAQLRDALTTNGPRDPIAGANLVTLGESVHAGMGIADGIADASLASGTRRAALAMARRVAVWRSATGLFATIAGQQAAEAAGAATPSREAVPLWSQRNEAEIAQLLHSLERFESTLSPTDAAVATATTAAIDASPQGVCRNVAKAVREHYLSANVRIAVHQQFLDKLLPAATVNTGPVDDVVLGRKVRGTRTVERTTTVRFTPDSDEICISLEVHGDVDSRTVTAAGPVSLTARGASSFTVSKPIKVCSAGLLFGDATGVASNRSQLDAIQTSFDSVPIMRSLVRNIAKSQHDEKMPEANREVTDLIIGRACREVDEQSEPQFAEIADRIRTKIWSPLVQLGLEPTAVAMETTQTVATVRLRLAGDGQLAAHTPRPRAPSDSMLSMQVHDSSLNNAMERLKLAGRRLSLEELMQILCEKVGMESTSAEDLPEGVAVTFAKEQPLRIECRDGLVHVRVTLDAIESGRRHWYDIVAHVAYKPSSSSAQVFLEREGPVQLSGPGHHGRMELALRTIFGKIFPKERPIPVLPGRIVENPRLAGMRVLQSVSSDGWLALAIGLREPAATANATLAPSLQRKRR